jgi:hypothetical protein
MTCSLRPLPLYLSPRRRTVGDRLALIRRSPLVRDLARITTKTVTAIRALRPRHAVALTIGVVVAAICCCLYSLDQSYPVASALVNGR